MADITFQTDLTNGQEAEIEFAELTMTTRPDIYSNYQLNASSTLEGLKEYDIKFQRKEPTRNGAMYTYVEVKNDYKSSKTNNIAIEYECSGKPSGISTTKASYWVQKVYEDRFIVFTVKELRKYIQQNNVKEVTCNNGKSKMYLLPIEELIKNTNNKILFSRKKGI